MLQRQPFALETLDGFVEKVDDEQDQSADDDEADDGSDRPGSARFTRTGSREKVDRKSGTGDERGETGLPSARKGTDQDCRIKCQERLHSGHRKLETSRDQDECGSCYISIARMPPE